MDSVPPSRSNSTVQQQQEEEKLWDEKEGYQKTEAHATTSGQDYEVALCCLFFLRALRLCGDFFLASNYKPAGKFDDVVLFYRLKGDPDPEYSAILLQAKHRDNAKRKTLAPEQLVEYVKSFKQIKDLWERPLVVDGRRRITLKGVTLVHYSNTGCLVDKHASDVTDLPDLRALLDTGGRLLRISEAQKVGLPEGEDTSEFLGKFLLCTQQMSVNTADEFLKEELGNVLGLKSVGDNVTAKLTSELKTWWGGAGRGKYLTADSDEWINVLVMRHNADTLALKSEMNLRFKHELDDVAAAAATTGLSGDNKTWIRVADTHQASVTRVRLVSAQQGKSLVVGAEYLAGHWAKVEALWGKSACSTLVVDVTSYPPFEYLLSSLQMAAQMDAARRRLVVIATVDQLPPSEGWNVVALPATWSSLDSETQERLLSVKVQLQGTADVALRDIVGGSSVGDVMTDKLIASLSAAKSAIRVGETMRALVDYYVPRCLQRTSARKITYQSLENTSTLIFSSDYCYDSFPSVTKIKYKDLKSKKEIQGLTLVRGKVSDSGIRNMCCKFRHRGVRVETDGEDLAGKVTEFLPLPWIHKDKILLIGGLPGVGKSSYVTSMCSEAKKEFPEAWIIRVDLARYTAHLQRADFSSRSQVVEFLLGAFSSKDDGLERHLLEHALRVTGNVFLFLDAFDEVCPDYTDKCCALIKGIAQWVRYRKMVVTTRPVTVSDVERALETEAFTLPVFSDEDQTLFFTRFSVDRKGSFDANEFTSFRQIAGNVIQIPLLCKMSAEVLLNRQEKSPFFEYNDPWRRVMLYQIFVEQCVKCIAEKLNLEPSSPLAREFLESNQTQHLHNLQGLAVRKLMPETVLPILHYSKVEPKEKFGLVVDTGGSVDFEHRTFAEYFFGCWLSDNWRHCPEKLLRDVLLLREDGGSHQFVAATFNWSLFRGFPLHEAVARGDVDAVRAHLAPGTTDGGGSSALHVAAKTRDCSREVLELLLASGEDLDAEDAVLGKSAVKYAETGRNWEFLEVMLEKGVRLDNLSFVSDQNAAREVLIHAIERDLGNIIKFILTLHENLFHCRFGPHRQSLLHVAALNNCKNGVKFLIESGVVEIDFEDKRCDTPFTLAAKEGHLEVVKLLLAVESKVNKNRQNKNEETALTLAAKNGHFEVVKLLVESEVDKTVKNVNGDTALTLAAREGHSKVVKLLLLAAAQSEVEKNVKNKNEDTALTLAAREGHAEVVKLLLEESGVDKNARNKNEDTALTMATKKERHEVVKLLLTESGVEKYARNKDGATAFILAVRKWNLNVLKLLIESEVETEAVNENGDTVLMLAAREGNLEFVKFLIERGVGKNSVNKNGDTAFTFSAKEGHHQVAKLLIENGEDKNVRNKSGDTLLMLAAKKGNLELVKFLVECGVGKHLLNKIGDTAFTLASKEGHLEVVKFLMESGVEMDLKNKNWDTALTTAAREGHCEVVKLLVESGAEVNLRNKSGDTALAAAAREGHFQVVKLLLESGGVDKGVENKTGDTAFTLAAKRGHLEVVKLLLECGVDKNAKNRNGETAFTLATKKGHLEVAKLLIEN